MANPIQDTKAQGQTLIMRLAGSLTVMSAPDLRHGLIEAIKDQQPKVLALNLGGVDFIDSSALGVFVEARREMIKADGSVAFTNVNDDVRGLMRIMNLESVFNFVDDEAELLATE